jgi:hypothetical protein
MTAYQGGDGEELLVHNWRVDLEEVAEKEAEAVPEWPPGS